MYQPKAFKSERANLYKEHTDKNENRIARRSKSVQVLHNYNLIDYLIASPFIIIY